MDVVSYEDIQRPVLTSEVYPMHVSEAQFRRRFWDSHEVVVEDRTPRLLPMGTERL